MEGTPLSTSAVKRTGVGEERPLAELREIDAGGDADGNSHETGEGEDDSGADDGVGHASTLLAYGSRDVGEEVEVEGACALEDEVEEDGDQGRDDDDRREDGERADEVVHRRCDGPCSGAWTSTGSPWDGWAGYSIGCVLMVSPPLPARRA